MEARWNNFKGKWSFFFPRMEHEHEHEHVFNSNNTSYFGNDDFITPYIALYRHVGELLLMTHW